MLREIQLQVAELRMAGPEQAGRGRPGCGPIVGAGPVWRGAEDMRVPTEKPSWE